MSETPTIVEKKRRINLSPTMRTLLGLLIIALIVVLGVTYGPHYDDNNTTSGDSVPLTVTVNASLGVLTLNKALVYQGVTITLQNVEEAKFFSDDNKSSYHHVKYIVRVRLHIQAPKTQNGAIGIAYSKLVHLVDADGSSFNPGLAQISPDVLPGQDETGFLDFWINTPLKLSSLTFTLDSKEVSFG